MMILRDAPTLLVRPEEYDLEGALEDVVREFARLDYTQKAHASVRLQHDRVGDRGLAQCWTDMLPIFPSIRPESHHGGRPRTAGLADRSFRS